MLTAPNREIRDQFVRQANALLVRAKAKEQGLMPEMDALDADYKAQVAAGWMDWEDDTLLHLKMLRSHVRKAS